MNKAIGLYELNSVARGVETADAMLKAGFVELLGAHPICPGKYLILIGGEIADINTSMAAGAETGGECITDRLILPNVHPTVFPAILGTTKVDILEAIGIIETFSCPSCVIAADAAAKAALVDLVEVRLGTGLGGKAFLTLTGQVGAVKAAINRGVELIADQGVLVQHVVIPQPHRKLYQAII